MMFYGLAFLSLFVNVVQVQFYLKNQVYFRAVVLHQNYKSQGHYVLLKLAASVTFFYQV